MGKPKDLPKIKVRVHGEPCEKALKNAAEYLVKIVKK